MFFFSSSPGCTVVMAARSRQMMPITRIRASSAVDNHFTTPEHSLVEQHLSTLKTIPAMKLSSRQTFLSLATLAFFVESVTSFVTKPSIPSTRSFSMKSFQASRDSVDSDMPQLYERLQNLKVTILEEELDRPPNAKLEPTQFVNKILEGLLDPFDPVPDAGFRRLLRASTPEWNAMIRQYIGAPADASAEIVASALGTAISRPNQQFGILVGAEDSEEFYVTFPSDIVDNMDGTCWLEVRLRSKENDALLVITGWELQQRPSDGAWIVAKIDWQDFRDQYRPGLGREEWERICG